MLETFDTEKQIPEITGWNSWWRGVWITCLLGFLSGVGMLHDYIAFGMIALVLSAALLVICLFATGYALVYFRKLGVWRTLASLFVGPVVWYGTIYMVSHYPSFKARRHFETHRVDFEQAATFAAANRARVEQGQAVINLPKKFSHLSWNGEALVGRLDSGEVTVAFMQSSDPFMKSPCISYSEKRVSTLGMFDQSNVLNDHWVLSSFDFD